MGKQRQKDPIKDKKRLIYDALIADDNYKNSLPSSFDSFSKTLENESSAISIYETLSKDDNYKNSLPDQSQWLDTFKKKDYTEVGGGDSQEVSAQQKEPSLESGGYKELAQELGLTGKIEDVSPDKREAIALGAYQQEVVKGVQLQLSNGTITEDEAQISINKKMDDYVNNTQKKEDNLLPEPGIVKGENKNITIKTIGPERAKEDLLRLAKNKISDKQYEDYTAFGLGMRIGGEMIKSIPDEMSIVHDNFLINENTQTIKVLDLLIDKYGEDYIVSTEKTKYKLGDYSDPLTLGQKKNNLSKESLKANIDAVEKYKKASARLAKWQRSDIPTGIGEINNIVDFGKFAASTLGQTAPQLAMTIGTFGTGTIFMETGMIQMQMIDELISSDPNLTPEIIFKKSLTDSDWAVGGGLVAGAMDIISLGIIAKATGLTKLSSKLIGKGAAELAKKQVKKGVEKTTIEEISKGLAVSTLTEMIQEPTQGVVESFSAAKGTGKEYSFNQEQFLTEMLAGGIMGLGIGGASTAIKTAISNKNKESKFDNVTKEQAIEQVREELDTSNPEAIEANAEALEVKINKELEKEGVVEKEPETKPNIEVKEDATPSADISKTEATKKEESEKKSNVGFKVKEETEKVSEELIKEGEQQVSKGLEMFGTESKQEDAVKEIGDGLIKKGVATDKNVAQKVKDYFKEHDVEQPNSIIEKVYPSKVLESEKPTEKTKGAKLKKELEKDIEKKDKQGNVVKNKGKYIQRVLADERRVPEFKELLKDHEEYSKQDIKLAEVRSNKFIKDFQEQFGKEEGLIEVSNILKSDKKSEGFPDIMIGSISSKIETLMNKLGMKEEALSVIKFKQEESRKAGRLLVGIREDSSPDEVISIMRDNIRTKKIENINEEFKEGKTYNQALKEMQTKIYELESAYKELKETGKIDESFLPEPDIETKTTKSKELKERAKTLRKKGTANLSAYFKSQRGGLSMGLKVDDKLLTALGQILQSYVLEFEGNVLAAYEKFRKDISDNYKQISQEDIDKAKKDLLSQSEEVINEFKDKKKLQIIEDILKADKKESKEQTDKRKEAAKNILNDINEGKSIEDISDNLSELAKFDKIDPKILDDILSISVEYGNLLNDGKLELASNKFDELMDKLYKLGLKNRGINEVMMDLWYTSVLSGLTTVRRSLFGSGITTAVFMGFRILSTPSMAPIMFSQMLKGSKGLFQNYWHVLKTGKSNVQIHDFKIKRGSYSAMLWRTKYKDLNKLNSAVKTIWVIPTFMFRNIVAWDQILKNSTSEANYSLYEFDNTDKSKTKKQRIKETETALLNEKDSEIESVVDEEILERKSKGEKIESGYKFRRFTEIKNTFRDADIIRKSMEDAAEAAMVGTPKGTLGRIYKGVITKAEIKKDDTLKIKAGKTVFKFIFPFFRIGFNWINAGLDFTPVGLSRGFSKEVWTKDGMIERTSFQKRELIAKSATGMMVTTGIMLSMFDWDDDEGIKLKDEKDMWVRVYGSLTGDYKTVPDTSLDAIPWSIQFRNPFTNDWMDALKYQDNPIGFALAPIGIMHDEIFFRDFKKEVKNKEVEKRKLMFLINGIVMGTYTYAMDKSFNQGINNLVKVFTADSVEDMGRSIKRLVINPIEGFYAGIYNQSYAQYRSMIGKPEKEYREWYERFPSKIPIVEGLIKNDKVDIFGYPYVKDFDFPFIPDFILKLAKENLDYRENIKSWKLLHKYENVVIGRFNPPEKDNKKNKLTNEQMDEYMLIAGLRMRRYVEDNYGDLIKKDRIKLQKKFLDYKKWSSEYAKNKISIKK